MNKTSASEWLKKAYHDLKSAQILYDAEHFTDSIGVDLHYGDDFDIYFNRGFMDELKGLLKR